MYWHGGVTFSTGGTVFGRGCHMPIISFPPVSYISMQFFWCSCWSPRNWAETQEPRHPVSLLHHRSDSPPSPVSYHSRPSPGANILHPVETFLCKSISGVDTMGSSCTTPDKMRRETKVMTMLCQPRSLYSPSCAPRFPSTGVKMCSCISFPSRGVALDWL